MNRFPRILERGKMLTSYLAVFAFEITFHYQPYHYVQWQGDVTGSGQSLLSCPKKLAAFLPASRAILSGQFNSWFNYHNPHYSSSSGLPELIHSEGFGLDEVLVIALYRSQNGSLE